MTGVRRRALGDPVLVVGSVLRALRVRHDHDHAGVLRGARVRREATGTDLFTALVGLLRAVAPPLRRLHRPHRHRAGLPGIRRQRASSGRTKSSLQPGPAGRRRRRTPCAISRLSVTDDGAEADGHGARSNVTRDGKPLGRHVSGALVLPQSRDRSRRPKSRCGARSRKTCTSCSPATTSARRPRSSR